MNFKKLEIKDGLLYLLGFGENIPRRRIRRWKSRSPLRKLGLAGDVEAMNHDRAMLNRDMAVAARRVYRELSADEKKRLDAKLESVGASGLLTVLREG